MQLANIRVIVAFIGLLWLSVGYALSQLFVSQNRAAAWAKQADSPQFVYFSLFLLVACVVLFLIEGNREEQE